MSSDSFAILKGSKTVRGLLALLVGLTLLVAPGIWFSAVQARRDQLDADLIMAAQAGLVADVKYLLAQGADANARDRPPEEASSRSVWDAVRRLFSRTQRGEKS